MSRMLRLIILLIVLMFACGAVSVIGLLLISGGNPVDYVQTSILRLSLSGRSADLHRSVGSSTDPVRFEIQSGSTPRTIAQSLANSQLILDSDLFVDYVRAEAIDTQLQAGVYFLTQAQTMIEIAEALTDSGSSQFPFRILEGWRSEEIAEAIDNNPYFGFSGDDFLAVVGAGATPSPDFSILVGLPAGASLEGFLFPNTYQMPAQVTPELLRDYLLEEFMTQAGDLADEAAAQGLSLFDVVRLASIVQREAVHADESAQIAGVYRNRLAIGMKLDADPTVQYGLAGSRGAWWPQITQADYSGVASVFNTYLNNGLPPSAISNPGLAAIQGVINAAQSPYLYFRAECNGSGYHIYATTFEEHVANGC
ncbi:MAG: endolytic transglycosylase MltG [Anaerolineae bacterium]|nr:endolytic transglycosylase MltG [Anaerolineae bacterium]